MDHLSHVLRPQVDGGILDLSGTVEVVSSLERDGRPVSKDLRWGVYVVLEAANEYAAKCFTQYGMNTDDTGRFSSMYKPFHLIGMELNTSIFSAAILKKATGCTKEFSGDVIATAKQIHGLPIGLANNVKLKRNVEKDAPVCWSDVDVDINAQRLRYEKK